MKFAIQLHRLKDIKEFMQLLKRNNQDKDYIEVMESELARVESILNEFLVLARPHEAKFQLHDISALLTQVITLMKVEANKHDIEVLENFQETEPLSCDPNQLKQVFINFIKNAIEAMPNGGTLEIIQTLQKAENQMVIQFNDNGCGMSEKVLKNWANPFNTTKETGTGLGVMISKNIIENHKGRLTVESEENKGTKITVYLPFNR